MRIRLIEDEPSQLVCPDHGCMMAFEDGDEYGAVYVCPVLECTRNIYDGLSRDEIFRHEQGVGYSGRVRAY
jgi:hypothetical protein